MADMIGESLEKEKHIDGNIKILKYIVEHQKAAFHLETDSSRRRRTGACSFSTAGDTGADGQIYSVLVLEDESYQTVLQAKIAVMAGLNLLSGFDD